MSDQVILALTTCRDEASAQAVSPALVQEHPAACVNRIGGVASTCFWDARLQEEAEILLIIKTTTGPLGGNERYLDWVRMGVTGKGVSR